MDMGTATPEGTTPKMNEALKMIDALQGGSIDQCKMLLEIFNTDNDKARSIDWLPPEEKTKLWANIFARLSDTTRNAKILVHLLNALRILSTDYLSREKETLEDVITDDYVRCLLRCSGLQFGFPRDPNIGPAEAMFGMKVIFNMIFQSEKLQNMLIDNKLLDALVMHIRPYDEAPLENQYFLLKTFFIITALSKKTGLIVRNDLNGIEVIVNYIDMMGNTIAPYDKLVADVICEALKVLYNIIHNIFPSHMDLIAEIFDSKDFTLLCKMCRLIRRNLLHHVDTTEKKLEVDCHSIHLLTVVPPECYDELLIDDDGTETGANRAVPIIFEGNDLTAIDCILNVLNVKLDCSDRSPSEPLLVVCCKMAKKNRVIRRYLKYRILPPLTKQDVTQRPEIGDSLRNKLCELIHTPAGGTTEVSATLLFTLCKENAAKLVKYTGYGNAAGLLADHGLMLGGKGGGVYSDDSDSETDEYQEVKDQIHSIEGWMKPEPPSLDMTEEQKEFEAMKLVETIDKLASSKSIQPCRIGPDGKPQPIGSVLELQEAMESSIKNAARLTGSDTDSD